MSYYIKSYNDTFNVFEKKHFVSLITALYNGEKLSLVTRIKIIRAYLISHEKNDSLGFVKYLAENLENNSNVEVAWNLALDALKARPATRTFY